MSSGFPGGGANFYSSAGIGAGSAMINDFQGQYRSQLRGILSNPSSQMVPGRSEMAGKRSLEEFERQQQHQLGLEVLLRSVKQRNYHHTSPISPLSPGAFSPEIPTGFTAPTLSGRYGLPLLQKLRPHPTNPIDAKSIHCNPSLSDLTFSSFVPNRVPIMESEPDSEKKMRNQLKELEKQLLDDLDEEEGEAVSVITNSEWSENMQNLITPIQKPLSASPEEEGDAVSIITNSEWSETMQNLITPIQKKPLSPSPTSSSSSSSSTSASPSYSNHSLLDAATTISEGNMDAATATLSRLEKVSKARADPEQRLTAYVVSALRSRLNPTENHPPVTELCSKEHMIATQLLYEASPCFKLGFMVANLAILEATSDQPNNVHVVDFDMGEGSQYITLIYALAERQSGKPTTIKFTTVTDPSNGNEDGLRIVGEGLKKLAERVGVGFKFNVVSGNICDLNRNSLGCEPNEALAVNFAFRLYKMPDESVSTENPRDELLRLVKSMAPRVVTLVEQEMNTNTAPFVARVAEACAYYGALFDSLDSTRDRFGGDRVRDRVEECLARKAANSVACEGRERVERCEVFGKWRARMGMAGFAPKQLGQRVSESMRARLSNAYPNNPGFIIKEEAGGICFGWKGRVLTVASAWA
ncbi:hypothetical protein HHK36_028991 [Tetracentron sinense]|uniref:Scarecrow-like protein 8 n=1 Tax=Tetracentron sinense TaxID=13715 RepID=A0A834YCH0_TETSI|nr:hypothetical protein HHK36_028991 [Tetracentron sinense]